MLEPCICTHAVVDFEDVTGDIKEDEYWEVIKRAEGVSMS